MQHQRLNSHQFGQKDQYKLLGRIEMSKIDLVCYEQYQISMVCQDNRNNYRLGLPTAAHSPKQMV